MAESLGVRGQSTHRPALSRSRRQYVSVSRLRAQQDRRHGRCAEPQRRRRDHPPRLVSAGGFESGYIAPDPLNPNMVFHRLVWHSDEARSTPPATGDSLCTDGELYTVWETPIILRAAMIRHVAYYGSQYLLKTTDGAVNWEVISPDMTSVGANNPAEARAGAGGHAPDPDEDEYNDPDGKDGDTKMPRSSLAAARFTALRRRRWKRE